MREIKFRAWHKGYAAKGKFSVIEPRMLYDEKIGDCLGYAAQRQPVELMQFIGKFDMVGNEVYEGDNILIHWTNCDATVETVTYDEKYGYYKYGNNPICELEDPHTDFEVIGNIYQNKELL